MTYKIKNKVEIQYLTIIAVILLIAVSFTLMLSSNEADSPFVLTLVEGENRIKIVTADAAGSTDFEMILDHKGGSSGLSGEIQLDVHHTTYYGGSQESHWDFKFLDDDYNPVPANVYYIPQSGDITVILSVSFVTGNEGEKVTFTITGHNTTNSERIETHLSPFGGSDSDFEYLTVYAGAECDVFWEPTAYEDRLTHLLPYDNTYHITLWNLGTNEDTLYITGWEVWQDVNGNGIIDSGDDQNMYFDIYFHLLGGEPNYIDESIVLGSLDSEELKVTVSCDDDREKVPKGYYLIEITVQAACGATHIDLLKAMVDPTVFLEEEISILEDMDIPEEAETDVAKAISNLEKAIDDFENDKIEQAIGKIGQATKDLMKAQDNGADSQAVIDNLVDFVITLTDDAIDKAIEEVGENNKHVKQALEHYNKALDYFDEEEYFDAINEFRLAYNKAMKVLK